MREITWREAVAALNAAQAIAIDGVVVPTWQSDSEDMDSEVLFSAEFEDSYSRVFEYIALRSDNPTVMLTKGTMELWCLSDMPGELSCEKLVLLDVWDLESKLSTNAS